VSRVENGRSGESLEGEMLPIEGQQIYICICAEKGIREGMGMQYVFKRCQRGRKLGISGISSGK